MLKTFARTRSSPTPTEQGPSARRVVRRALVRSAAVALAMLLAVGTATVFWVSHLAREEALRDAANLGETSASSVIRSLTTPQPWLATPWRRPPWTT